MGDRETGRAYLLGWCNGAVGCTPDRIEGLIRAELEASARDIQALENWRAGKLTICATCRGGIISTCQECSGTGEIPALAG